MKRTQKKFLSIATEAAMIGNRILMNRFNAHDIRVSKKADETWVTDVDIETEKEISQYLQKHTPDIPILAEETTPAYRTQKGYKWIVDPLDGTPNYQHGIPLFSISIALELNGEITLGVLRLPYEDITITAIHGYGAHVQKKKLRIPRRKLKDSILALETYFDKTDVRNLHKFVGRVQEVRILNSACTVLAYVALGRIDACIDRVDKPWDWAAGSLIVSEAGGVVTNFQGKRLDLYTPSFVAANPGCHREIISIVKGTKA